MLGGPTYKVRLLTVVVALMLMASRANADAKGKPGAQILIRNPGEPGSKPFPGFVPVKPEPDLNLFQTSAAEHRFANRDALPENSEETQLEPVKRKTLQPVSRLRSKTVTVPDPSDKAIEPVKRTRFRTKSVPRKIVLKRRKVKKFRTRPKSRPNSDPPNLPNNSDILNNQILDDGVALAPEAQRGGSLAELAFATLTDEEQKSESREARVTPRNRDIQIMKSPRRKPKSSAEKVTAVSTNRLRTKPHAASRLRNKAPESSDNNASLRNNLFGPRKRFKGIIRKETRSQAEKIIGPKNKPSFIPTRQSLVIKAPDSPFPNFPANKGGEVDIEVQIQEQRDGRAEDDVNLPNIGFEELTLNPRQNMDADSATDTFMPILRPETKERQRFSAVSAVPDSQAVNNPIGQQDEDQFSDFRSQTPINQIDIDLFPVNRDLNRSPVRGEPLPITQFLNPNLPFDEEPLEQPRELAQEQVPPFPNIFNNPNPKARRRNPQIQTKVIPSVEPLNAPQIRPIPQLNTQTLPTPQPIFQSQSPIPQVSVQNPSPTPQSIFPNPTQAFFEEPKSSNFPSFPAGSILPAIVPVRPLPNPRVVPVRPLPNPRLVPGNTNLAKQPNQLSQQFPPILQEIPESPAATPLVPVGGLGDPVTQGIFNLGAGGLNSHTETRVGNSVQGQYSYTDVDGAVKVVSYKTDGPNSLPQITHTTEAPHSMHHQTSPHSVKNSASHIIHHPTRRPVAHGSNSPSPVHQPTVVPNPHPIPQHPQDPAFSVRHHGSTVVPRKRVTQPPIQTHPSNAPQQSAIHHPPQAPPTPTPVNIFKSPTQHHASAQFHYFPTPGPHERPTLNPTQAPYHGLPQHGSTQVQHNGPPQHSPTQVPHHGPPQQGPTQVSHHGPPQLGPTQVTHHGPTQHGPTFVPHQGPPHLGPKLSPHQGLSQDGPTLSHHGPSRAPHNGPSQPRPILPHHPHPFVHHGSSNVAHHGPTKAKPGNAIVPSFTPASFHHQNPFNHNQGKRPRFLHHPQVHPYPSPTPYPTHPNPYASPIYHGGHVPNPSFPINHPHHPLNQKVPSLTFFPTASPIKPYHVTPTAHPLNRPTPEPHISVHPETNRPTVHHSKPTPSPYPSPTPTPLLHHSKPTLSPYPSPTPTPLLHHSKPTPSPYPSPTPTPLLRVVNEHYPSPSPVPLLYQPNRIVFTPKPFIHTSVRPVAIHHTTPAPFHGSSRAPIIHSTPTPIYHSSPAPIFHSSPAPIYQPTSPVPLHLRTPMAYHASPHPHTTPAPVFHSGPTPTPSHYFFSTPYPITPYPPLKYSPTPPPTPFIVPANFPSNGHGFPAHVSVATARTHDINQEVPEIAQESVDNLSVSNPPKSISNISAASRSDDKILEAVGNNTVEEDDTTGKDTLKRSIHTQRRNPKKYRTSRNYRHFYEKS